MAGLMSMIQGVAVENHNNMKDQMIICTNNEGSNMECSYKLRSESVANERFLSSTELKDDDSKKSDEEDLA